MSAPAAGSETALNISDTSAGVWDDINEFPVFYKTDIDEKEGGVDGIDQAGQWDFATPALRNASRTYPRPKPDAETAPIVAVFHPDSDSKSGRPSRITDLYTLYCYGKKFLEDGFVTTMYKRKADKVRPVDSDKSDGSTPGGRTDWRERALARQISLMPLAVPHAFDQYFEPRYTHAPRGYRLTAERLKDIKIGIELSSNERDLFNEMLYRREPALAWTFQHIGRLNPEVLPPTKIRTIPHKAWQAAAYQVPKPLREEAVRMFRERIEAGTLEPGYGPYRNPWFLVEKKDGGHRVINSAVHINAVTIRDAMLPPDVEEFAEHVSGRPLISLTDIFSGFDNNGLHKESRDMTAIATPLGLLRQTTLPMGWTNSPPEFCRSMAKIVEAHMPNVAQPYVDDLVTTNDRGGSMETLALAGVRKEVLVHIQRLDQVLADIERANIVIAGSKSHFLSQRLQVVGYDCGADGRRPSRSKVVAILEWTVCRNVREARGFLGVCTYYRIFICDYARIAEPIFRLLRKNVVYVWTDEQDYAMNALKQALTTAPALAPIEYGPFAGLIIVAVDASGTGYGFVLMQIKLDDRRHPIRFDSGLWSESERKYDAGKLECRGLLHALKKLRPYLYGVRFVVETDAKTLTWQLNRTASDLPSAMVTRWIAWIQLFDFEVRHIPGSKNVVADALSRKSVGPMASDDDEEDIDDWVDAHLDSILVSVCAGSTIEEESENDNDWLDSSYGPDLRAMAEWLTTLRRPDGYTRQQYTTLRKRALKFVVQGRFLYRRNSRNAPLVRVIDGDANKKAIIRELHDESGHRKREGTYRKVADRYWWDGMYTDVVRYIKSCDECQFRDHRQLEEPLHPTWSVVVGRKWAVDVVHMPSAEGKEYLVLAREDISGWPEGRALRDNNSASVAKFLYEDVVCRHGVMELLINDGGPENKAWTEVLMEAYGVRNVRVSGYHPQANGMIERGHRPIVDALAKLGKSRRRKWPSFLHSVLWADRITVRSTTGLTPSMVRYGNEQVLPIELLHPSLSNANWSEIHSRSDLLAARASQIDRRDTNIEEARLRVRRLREWNKEVFDNKHILRHVPLQAGDLVLRYDSVRATNMSSSRKLAPRWQGPFRIREAYPDIGTYKLAELDGTELPRSSPGRLLKLFHQPEQEDEPEHAPNDDLTDDPFVGIPQEEANPDEFEYFSSDEA